jgi:hypothetical protein
LTASPRMHGKRAEPRPAVRQAETIGPFLP